jgi:hypothetical protein
MEFLRWVGSTLVGALTVLVLVATFGWSRMSEMVDSKVDAKVSEAIAPVTAQLASLSMEMAGTKAAVSALALQMQNSTERQGTDWTAQAQSTGSTQARLGAIEEALREIKVELRLLRAGARP